MGLGLPGRADEAYDRQVRFGISVSSTHSVADHRLGSRWMVERAGVAREAELDHICLGDGHTRASPYYQGVPTLGRMLAEWDISRPAGCLFLLPLWHPVIVAEQVATLATMLDAPFLLQTGVGGGTAQFAAMGADLASRGRDLDESIRVIKSLLAGDTVDSERYGLTGARMSPLPPEPVEWWIGASAPVAIRRAAREGDAWYAGPNITPVEVVQAFDVYRPACEEFGRRPRSVRRRDVIVLRDEHRARSLGDELVGSGYRGMGESALAYGGVTEVADILRADLDAGFDDIAVRCMSIDQPDALETIEQCGQVRARLL